MLMNPTYPPACYADMYRGHVPPHAPSYHQPTAATTASAPIIPQSYHHNNNIHTTDFYGNSQLSGSCYSTPSPHGLLSGMDNNGPAARSLVPQSYGYSCSMPDMEQSLHMYQPPGQGLWQNPHSLVDEKRGPVIMGQPPPQPPVKRKGGRKPKDDPNLPPIEKEKRRLRRLRNKEAAAKCRERRLNHTSNLLQQIEQLEKSQKSFEEKINQLRQHKEDCEKLLKTHGQKCNKTFPAKSPAAASATSGSLTAQSSAASSPASIKTPSPKTPSTPAATISAPTAPLNQLALSHSTSRRKQTTPRLNLDVSCSDSHRRTSSSSSGELQSPPVIL